MRALGIGIIMTAGALLCRGLMDIKVDPVLCTLAYLILEELRVVRLKAQEQSNTLRGLENEVKSKRGE